MSKIIKIFLVDDDQLVRDSIINYLELKKYDIKGFS